MRSRGRSFAPLPSSVPVGPGRRSPRRPAGAPTTSASIASREQRASPSEPVEHRLVELGLGRQLLQVLRLVRLHRIELVPPAVIDRLGDLEMTIDLRDGLTVCDQFVGLGELVDDLLVAVMTSLYMCKCSLPILGHRSCITGWIRSRAPVWVPSFARRCGNSLLSWESSPQENRRVVVQLPISRRSLSNWCSGSGLFARSAARI